MSNISNFFKNLLINKPAAWFNEFVYIRYIILISRLINGNSFLKISNYKVFSSKSFSHFKIHSITTKNKNIYFQSGIRINRFIKGFNYAGKRMWDRYHVDELLNGEIPSNILMLAQILANFHFMPQISMVKRLKLLQLSQTPLL